MGESPLRVLLIENHAGDAAIVQGLLPEPELSGFDFILDDGKGGALAITDQHPIDVVLLDLPDEGASDMISALQARTHSRPMVILRQDEIELPDPVAGGPANLDYLVKGKFDGLALCRTLRHAVESSRLKEQIKALTLTDELTGLQSRRGLTILGRHQLCLANRTGCGATMIYIDIHNMGWINENLGRAEGDQAILDTTAILRKTFRASDVIARVAGDEFAVLALETGRVPAEVFERRIEKNIETFIFAADRPYEIELNIGAAYFDPDRPCTVDELILLADQVMVDRSLAKRSSVAA